MVPRRLHLRVRRRRRPMLMFSTVSPPRQRRQGGRRKEAAGPSCPVCPTSPLVTLPPPPVFFSPSLNLTPTPTVLCLSLQKRHAVFSACKQMHTSKAHYTSWTVRVRDRSPAALPSLLTGTSRQLSLIRPMLTRPIYPLLDSCQLQPPPCSHWRRRGTQHGQSHWKWAEAVFFHSFLFSKCFCFLLFPFSSLLWIFQLQPQVFPKFLFVLCCFEVSCLQGLLTTAASQGKSFVRSPCLKVHRVWKAVSCS